MSMCKCKFSTKTVKNIDFNVDFLGAQFLEGGPTKIVILIAEKHINNCELLFRDCLKVIRY